MARIAVVVVLVAGVAAAGAVVFAHGSQAAGEAQALPASPAAQIQRTFVSTSGSDTAPCTRAEPCRGFQAAIANTLTGGEVVALDSGGYGPFSVDTSITVAGAPGAHVAVTVFSGDGITVNAGTSATVVLRSLYLTGLGGSRGIFFQAGGALLVDSVNASGFTSHGLHATAADGRLVVRDSVFRDNDNTGVVVEGSLQVQIEGTHADGNNRGFLLFNGAKGSVVHSGASRNSQGGFNVQLGARFAISDSVADGNGGAGVSVLEAGTVADLTSVRLSNNATGLIVLVETPVARIGGSAVTGNATGLFRAGGTLETYQDNLVRGNGTDVSGTITAVGKT